MHWREGRPSLGLKLRLVHLIPCHLDPGMGLEDLGLVSLPVHPPCEHSASPALAAGPGRHGVTPSFGSEGGEASDGVSTPVTKFRAREESEQGVAEPELPGSRPRVGRRLAPVKAPLYDGGHK